MLCTFPPSLCTEEGGQCTQKWLFIDLQFGEEETWKPE